jgi:FtsP/CotA-like multicopper oxidase with cupredoxin domain
MKFQIAIVFAAFAVCATAEDLQNRVRRMYGDRAGFAELWSRLGAELMSNPDGANTNEKAIISYLERMLPAESGRVNNDLASEESEECYSLMSVRAKTGDGRYEGQGGSGNPKLEVLLTNGQKYRATLTGNKDRGSYVVREFEIGRDFQYGSNCWTRSQIAGVALVAGGNDGWFVASFATYLANSDKPHVKLTCDQHFNKWVDGNNKYPYDATYIYLSLFESMPAEHHCITRLKIEAQTATNYYAGFGSTSHHIQLVLRDGAVIEGDLKGPAERGSPYTRELSLEHDFSAWCRCVKRSDIEHVKLVAGSNNGWLVSSIKTHYFTKEAWAFKELTSDLNFNKWLDGDEKYTYDATQHFLSLSPFIDTPTCGYGVPVCECAEGATTCTFNLEIDEMMTFTSYQKFGIGVNEGLFVRGREGVMYYVDNATGEVVPHPTHANRKCAIDYNENDCSEPQLVDGKTFRMVIGVNGQVPGPTLIVHDGQKVIIHVHNNMTTEGVSIHWHGMYQMGTPWMDGVGQVTQCQIGPSSSFSYMYLARPSGTFWYHSHSGAQRTDGFFGALIVKETKQHHSTVKTELAKFGVGDYEDFPDKHTLTLIDWHKEAALDTFTQKNAGLGLFPQLPIGQLPPPTATPYRITLGYESAGIGPSPFFSGLINGKGRHEDVPYAATRLSIFTAEEGHRYRFRLVGAQGTYAYRFSIDGHNMTVVGTDGFWIKPQEDVDYIIIHTGERYDFILEANAPFGNYWIRAETLEIMHQGLGPPYKSLGHIAEGILQYKRPNQKAPVIKSTEYESIKMDSPQRECTYTDRCKAVNCPFKDFHRAYFTDCINVDQLQMLLQTPPEELPDSNPCTEEGCRHFLNFNFEGHSRRASANGRSFLLPPVPPVTQNESFHEQAFECDVNEKCNPPTLACLCTHRITIPYQKTVQLVFSSLGGINAVHPIHLHGHTFHIAKIGYPEYDPATGFIKKDSNGVSVHNSDITCDDKIMCSLPGSECDPTKCTKPRWTNPTHPPITTVHDRTVRKDTVMVPAGGYVAINFKSDNPGQWFLHCHIEDHQLQGMALIVNEAPEEQKKFMIPDELNKCGDFTLTMEEYEHLQSMPGLYAAHQSSYSYPPRYDPYQHF